MCLFGNNLFRPIYHPDGWPLCLSAPNSSTVANFRSAFYLILGTRVPGAALSFSIALIIFLILSRFLVLVGLFLLLSVCLIVRPFRLA